MANKLDEIIDVFVKEHYKKHFKVHVDEKEKENILQMLKDRTHTEIMEEIRLELKSEIEEEVKLAIEEQNRLNKLSDLKKLIAEGFGLAFFVGLFVNQATEIIDFYKGASSDFPIAITWIISLVLVFICGIILFTGFIKEFTKMYNSYKKGKSDNEKN